MKPMDFLVCTRCFTFNHAPYIEDAMSGFCMQQTNFPYVCVIVDDASTDGEQDVIKSYLANHFITDNYEMARKEETEDYVMTFAQHKTNANCFFAVYLLKYNHYSIKKNKFPYFSEYYDSIKYIAICEGDDYWIVPEKLQKQVDIMEKDNSVGLVYTKANKLIDKKGKISRIIGERFNTIDELVVENRIPTLTTCFRKRVYDVCLKELGTNLQGLSLGDYQLWIMFKIHSNVVLYDRVCGTYRVLEESAAHSKSVEKMISFYSDKYTVQSYFIQNYPDMFKNKKNHIVILDQLEWDKYRVLQKGQNSNYSLSIESFNNLNFKHKVIYCINRAIHVLGLSI